MDESGAAHKTFLIDQVILKKKKFFCVDQGPQNTNEINLTVTNCDTNGEYHVPEQPRHATSARPERLKPKLLIYGRRDT